MLELYVVIFPGAVMFCVVLVDSVTLDIFEINPVDSVTDLQGVAVCVLAVRVLADSDVVSEDREFCDCINGHGLDSTIAVRRYHISVAGDGGGRILADL